MENETKRSMYVGGKTEMYELYTFPLQLGSTFMETNNYRSCTAIVCIHVIVCE